MRIPGHYHDGPAGLLAEARVRIPRDYLDGPVGLVAEATAASSVVFLFLTGLCIITCVCFLDVRGIHHTGGGAEKRWRGLAIVPKPKVAATSCVGETSLLCVR